jgi:hypothetical protein
MKLYNLFNVVSIGSITLLKNNKFVLPIVIGYSLVDTLIIKKKKIHSKRKENQLILHHCATVSLSLLSTLPNNEHTRVFIPKILEIEKSGDPTRAFSVVGVKFASQNGKVRYTSDKGYRAGKESLANYIVQRKAPYYHGTHFCASSILISRQLLETIEFNEVENFHEDWDFIIRLGKMPNVRVVQLPARLVQMNQGSPNSISAVRQWSKSLAFLETFNDDIYGRARFDFILCHVLLPAILLKSFTGFISGAKRLPCAIPHYGAVVRFFGGLIFRR